MRIVDDGFLYTLVSHGKRVIVTGTESLCLEALKSGPLIHRAITLHTIHMSFPEYCRLYDKAMDKNTCDTYLTQGGIFESYVINNEHTMTNYIEEAIIIHPGENDWQTHISGKEVAVVNQDASYVIYYI